MNYFYTEKGLKINNQKIKDIIDKRIERNKFWNLFCTEKGLKNKF
jgi:hypothetical protein